MDLCYKQHWSSHKTTQHASNMTDDWQERYKDLEEAYNELKEIQEANAEYEKELVQEVEEK